MTGVGSVAERGGWGVGGHTRARGAFLPGEAPIGAAAGGVTRGGPGGRDDCGACGAGARASGDSQEPGMSRKKKRDTVDPDREPTEADRQQDVQPWARAFGVSSDDLSGATAGEESLERDEVDPERKGAR